LVTFCCRPNPAHADNGEPNLHKTVRTIGANDMEQEQRIAPTFGPFIETCRAHGIGKTTAYELLNAGLVRTFCVGRRRFIMHDSLRELPTKLAAPQAAA
jgi:hypothetical protein